MCMTCCSNTLPDGFDSTKPGPYFYVKQFQSQGKFGSVGGRLRTTHVLRKHHHHHKPAHGEPAPSDPSPPSSGGNAPPSSDPHAGEVTAEDIQNDSLYLCPVKIGTPAQTLFLDFDTGSSDLWVWSTELPQSTLDKAKPETQQVAFDATKSSTFKKLSGATWKISYGDGSGASGDVGTDVIDLGGLKIENQAIELAKQLSQQFQQGNGSGLLGLAFSSINTVSPNPQQTPVDNAIAQKNVTQPLFTAYLGKC